MSELSDNLDRLALSQYLPRLVEEGFETWETVLDITESDLSFLEFKLGHRRRLQREIAKQRGLPDIEPIPLSYQQSFSDEALEDLEDKASPQPYGKGATQGKRKYKRHPKVDENAPEKPPSAYVMFANHIREELKGQGLSFSEMAKHVGEKWKILNLEVREEYEYQAASAKEKYGQEMVEYKKTESFREYDHYLKDFKARTNKEPSSTDVVTTPNDPSRKRPKLESLPNSGPGSLQSSIPSSNTTATTGSLGTSTSTAQVPGTRSGRRHAGSVSSTESGPNSAGMMPTSSYSSPGASASTPAMHPSQHHSSQHYRTQASPSTYANISRTQSLIHQQQPPSPVSHLPSVATYNDAMAQQTELQQLEAFKAPSQMSGGNYNSDNLTDALLLSRMHSQTHSTHIQPNLSYSRGHPSPSGSPSQYNRRGTSQSRNPLQQRSDTVSTIGSKSSSDSASVASITPLTPADRDSYEANRQGSGYSRALPLPHPSPGVTPPGYFEQRPQGRVLPPLVALGPSYASSGNAASPSRTQLPPFDRSRQSQHEDMQPDQGP